MGEKISGNIIVILLGLVGAVCGLINFFTGKNFPDFFRHLPAASANDTTLPEMIEERKQVYAKTNIRTKSTIMFLIGLVACASGLVGLFTGKGIVEVITGNEGSKPIETVSPSDGNVNSRVAYIYDEAGNLKRAIFYNDDGSVMVNEYGSDGIITKTTVYNNIDEGNNEGSLMGNSAEATEDKSKKITIGNTNSGTKINVNVDKDDNTGDTTKKIEGDIDGGWWEYEYDSDGKQIKGTKFNADGIIESYGVMEYDSGGNLTKDTLYNADGSTIEVHDFDSKGNHMKTTGYDSTGNVDYYDIFERNDTGETIKWTHGNADGSRNEFEYDSDGNTKKATVYNVEGEADYVNEFEYDSDGNETKVTVYDADGNVFVLTPEEDEPSSP